MFEREILNKNRTLTMSNNRKCNYLIMRVTKDVTTFMATRMDENTKDIVLVKTIKNKNMEEVVEEATKLSYEFGITKILGRVDRATIETFIRDGLFVKNKDLMYSEISSRLFLNSLHIIKTEINESQIRFLQCPESALNSYKKPFLGYSETMDYHSETSLLIDELCDGKMNENKLDDYFNEKKDSYRLECLAMLYHYLKRQMFEEIEDRQAAIEVSKINEEIRKKIFFKYVFKAVENENIKIMFFLKNAYQFKNDIKKYIPEIEGLLHIKIKSTIAAILCNLDFENGSRIAIVEDINLRGIKNDYAIIDKGLFYDGEYRDIIGLTLYNSKVENNIEFLDMED